MQTAKPSPHALRVSDLPQNRPVQVALSPGADQLRALADTLGLDELRKLRFDAEIKAQGKRDFVLTGTLGATVVQPCVVSLAPVTTRIDTPLRRLYAANYVIPEGDEIEMPEDDTVEPLGQWIDPEAVMIEALTLALPLYPRAPGAELGDARFTEDGVTPMSDEAARPFAGLAELRQKLSGDDTND